MLETPVFVHVLMCIIPAKTVLGTLEFVYVPAGVHGYGHRPPIAGDSAFARVRITSDPNMGIES